MHTIDVYILTGFVGAGKTTLLNHLLRNKPLASENPALIINEFGRIGVDGALVEKQDLTRYDINKGSIFCICTKTDFLKALTEIADGGEHQTLLIEATGIAETVDIESFLDAPKLEDIYRIKANLCLVDAANFTRVAAFLKPAKTQVQYADALIVNKCDLVSDAERTTLGQILESLNPTAARVETEYGKIQADFLKDIQHSIHDDKTLEQPPEDIIAVSISSEQPYDRDAFFRTLDDLKDHLLRLKGNINFGDGVRFVELAGTEVTETNPSAELKKQNNAKTAFTAIAWKIDKDTLQAKLAACQHS
ncbi:MAG: GTP-binding protein [Planctomycetota bacterium]